MVLIPDKTLPYVSANLTYSGGDALLKPSEQGLSALVSNVLTKGTAKRSATEMQAFLDHVADQVVSMLTDRDTKTAEEIILNDDKLDALHKKTFELAQSEDWKGTNQQLIDVVLIGRFMERLGDHAVSAARRVVYIVSGFDPTKEPTRDEGTDID